MKLRQESPLLVLALLWTLLLLGCSTPSLVWRESTGSSKSDDLCRVIADWTDAYKLYFLSVDGRRLKTSHLSGMTQILLLKPGRHRLGVGYEREIVGFGANGTSTSHTFGELIIDAEKGKTYSIHRSIEGYQVKFSYDFAE